jgi:hypothetical protein
MNPSKLEINLKFNPDDFWEVFGIDGGWMFMKYPHLVTHFKMMALGFSGLLVFGVLWYYGDEFAFTFTFLMFFTYYHFSLFFADNSKLLKHKESVKVYIDDIAKYQTHKLKLTKSFISLLLDDEESCYNMALVKEIEIKEKHVRIILDTTRYLLFPKKSMSEKDYSDFLTFIDENTHSL